MPTIEPYTYFQPGELLFLLTHGGDQQIDQQIDNFNGILGDWVSCIDATAKGKFPELTVHRCEEREIHFMGNSDKPHPPTQGIVYPGSMHELPATTRHSAFSLIPVEVRLPTGDRVTNPQLVELLSYLELEDQKTDLQKKLNGGVFPGETAIDTILLNWLAGPASEYGGGGGPAGRPEPYQPNQAIAGNVPYQFDMPTAQKFLKPNGGDGITVAILDTAPNLHDMAAAYERYHKVNPLNRKEVHGLIESLLRRGGRFHVHPASLDELLRMRAVHLRDHNYEMSDHGLFVAGIIHTIAPEAEIHLYEVLNPYGVGDLASIAKGLREVLDRFSGQRLVVNCSFMLNIPLSGHSTTDLDRRLLESSLSERPGDWLADQAKVIKWICDQLLWQGSRVIAAAGNDWRANQARPQARFPAAFDSVLGVGALPQNALPNSSNQYSPASYSNLSDVPEEWGVATLGGEAGQGNGILGIYLGKFPTPGLLQKYPFLKPIFAFWWWNCSGPENKYNWAWWSGTSFATPIVTGLIASAFGDFIKPAIVEDAIGTLYGSGAIQELSTTGREDGIVGVRQV